MIDDLLRKEVKTTLFLVSLLVVVEDLKMHDCKERGQMGITAILGRDCLNDPILLPNLIDK